MEKIKVFKPFTIFLVLASMMTISNNIGNSMMSEEQKVAFLQPAKKEVVAKQVDPKQLNCLANNIFWEANGEPYYGQVAVARVVMNRIAHGFGKNPCNVIYQANYIDLLNEEGETNRVKVCQFSWVCEGKGDPPKNSSNYQLAKKIAYEVLANNAYVDLLPKSTLFFHSQFINPNWPYYKVAKIGNHIFYSKTKPKKEIIKDETKNQSST